MKIPMAIIRMARVAGLSERYEPSKPRRAPSNVYAVIFAIRNRRIGKAEFE
jgi:hypothetical protein